MVHELITIAKQWSSYIILQMFTLYDVQLNDKAIQRLYLLHVHYEFRVRVLYNYNYKDNSKLMLEEHHKIIVSLSL